VPWLSGADHVGSEWTDMVTFMLRYFLQVGHPNDNIPPELMRRYEVVIRPQSKQKPLKLREVSADHIGRLVTLQVSAAEYNAALHFHNICKYQGRANLLSKQKGTFMQAYIDCRGL
jgi:hypothetical protein